jgi:hypothetical protein
MEQTRLDPFIVSRSQSSLFESRTLHQRLQQDRDGLVCWLSDIALAKRRQADIQERAVQAARQFFFHGLGEGMRTHQSLPRKQTGPLPAHMAAYWELIPAGGTDQWVVFQMKN